MKTILTIIAVTMIIFDVIGHAVNDPDRKRFGTRSYFIGSCIGHLIARATIGFFWYIIYLQILGND